MKKYVYYLCFTILGLLLATLLHAGLEMLALHTLTSDLGRYGQSYLWQNWQTIHSVGSSVLWLVGLVLGLWGGRHFWQVLYVEKRYGTPRF